MTDRTTPTIGSIFSGYGGLEMGVAAALGGARVAWHAEVEPAPSRILAHHWPDVPNLGGIAAVDWACVEPVDVITGGFPCQDVSLAGRRAGLIRDGNGRTRSGLWGEMIRAIDTIRPTLVVAENVRGLLSAEADSDVEPCPWCLGDGGGEPAVRALGAVLADLADLGYDATWCGLRAADVGAPHGRFRVFIAATPADTPHVGHERSRDTRGRRPRPSNGRGTAADSDSDAVRLESVDLAGSGSAAEPGRPGATPADTDGRGLGSLGWVDTIGRDPHGRRSADQPREAAEPQAWGPYADAVARWERVLGRTAPAPDEPGHSRRRLNPAFVEWLMGLPAGHVTDPAIGLTRAEQLKALGNGVVPQQAAAAVQWILHMGESDDSDQLP